MEKYFEEALPSMEEINAMSDIASGKCASVNMDVLKNVMEGVYNGGELTLIPYSPNETPGIYGILTYPKNKDIYEECGWTPVDGTAISILVKLLSTEYDTDVKELKKNYTDYFKSDAHTVTPKEGFLLEFFKNNFDKNKEKLCKRIRNKAENRISKRSARSLVNVDNIFVMEKIFPQGLIRFRLSLDDDKTMQYLKDNAFLHEQKLF